MRELHVVALSSDGRHVILTARKGSPKGAYLLAVSPRLKKILEGGSNGPPEPPPPPPPPAESKLSPREIQARLRSGQAPERVARAAGVPVERVTRFYGPVLSERALVLDAAREATLVRARRGPSAAPLGQAVVANLAARRAVPLDADAWSAHRRDDGTWVIGLDAVVRGRHRRVEWVWDPAARSITTSDTYAADLGHVATPVPRRAVTVRKVTKPAKPAKVGKPAKAGRGAATKPGATGRRTPRR